MENQVKKISLYSLLTLLVVVIICVGVFIKSDVKQNLSGTSGLSTYGRPVDLIGTKTGTSTVGVGFSITSTGGQSATSTYPKLIGADVDEVIYTLGIKNASSTANLHFSMLGSNDTRCETASTTSSLNYITIGEINWFDIGQHERLTQITNPLSVGTSTLSWDNPAVGSGKPIVLEDLNYDCVALQVSGSSTSLWVQISTKTY